MIDRSDPLWYRDAIIYQVHVKSFYDSNGDGVGDFAGLSEKLDYIRDLGATAIWLMPFYPSPLRDDGYDIADYKTINPVYGTMRDFTRLIRAAHARGLRVITELVINHTSDQHPWFKRARAAKPGSAARDFYVWSDTAKPFADARVIFVDSEPSNWTWDPVAKAYFWHRFYSHQPDLNFDNPRVTDAVLATMRHWLDMGVDGLRLDAIPYLVERDGTHCENLPETHAIIKKIRAEVDAHYPDRMLLAEANQWPEDAAAYFGDGDECHMCFHFPLMPRIFISIATEDRHPVTDIMRQTPEIPAGAQWAIFLRNHDELTLEMVTSTERDRLWSYFASEKRARINLGIRRRLAPLLENDRRKIELLNCLLLSMPGTPIIYYGDEIGMGDNIYLGDRDGVRTPMQWSPDRNGGFSKSNPARLYLPPIQDSIYGFTSVNVEAQASNPSSLLNWMRGMISVRRRHQAFGRGGLHFLYPGNRKVLAYLRHDQTETILCVANVSGSPQAVELDLAEFKGAVPKELGAGSDFPPIGGLPYLLTLPAYGFYWFLLEAADADRERFGPAPIMELFTLVLTDQPECLLTGREATAFEQTIAPRFLMARRWYAGKESGVGKVKIVENAVLPAANTGKTFLLLGLEVEDQIGLQHYFAPLVVDEDRHDEGANPYVIAQVRRASKIGSLIDAEADADFARAMLAAFHSGMRLPLSGGRALRFTTSPFFAAASDNVPDSVRRLAGEQSNSSILIGERLVLKLYRKLQIGLNPEIEMTRYLVESAGFKNVAAVLGSVVVENPEGDPLSIAMLQTFVPNLGDAWTFVLDDLKRHLSQPVLASPEPDEEETGDESFLPQVLGRRTAELHLALARPTDDPAFAPEQMDPTAKQESQSTTASAKRAFAILERLVTRGSGSERASALLEQRDDCLGLIDRLSRGAEGLIRTRVHGDFHLGQVLITGKDVVIVDFEGEPGRSADERRAKMSPLADVAGMIRSFAYSGEVAALDVTTRLALDPDTVRRRARDWVRGAAREFLQSYRDRVGAPKGEAAAAWENHLRLQLLRKAFYEIDYEANNRPEWVRIPIDGILEIMSKSKEIA